MPDSLPIPDAAPPTQPQAVPEPPAKRSAGWMWFTRVVFTGLLAVVAGAAKSANEALIRDTGDAEAYHLRGRAYLGMGKVREAIDSFKGATQLDPGHAFAFNNLGYAYLLAGKYQQAEEALVNAATLAPDVAIIENNLGLAEEKLGKVDAAKAAFTKATMIKPGYVAAHVNLGRLANVAAAETSSDVEVVTPDDAIDAHTDGGTSVANPAIPPAPASEK